MAELTTIEDWRAPRRAGLGVWFERLHEAEEQRWFLWLPVMFGIGIALYFGQHNEPALMVVAAIAICLAVLLLFVKSLAGGVFSAALLAISLGGLAAKLRTEVVRAPVLERQLANVDVVGWIERVEPRATRGQRITLHVVRLGDLGADKMPTRVRVRTLTEDKTLKPGQAVRISASIGPPPAPAAPGDFDFGRLAYFAGLGGVGVAFKAVERLSLETAPPWRLRLQGPVEHLRQAIRDRITAALPGEAGEIATALITGERGGISEETNQAYRSSGLFHILSISGLHMVIMAGAVFYLLRLVLAAVPRIALRYPIKAWAAFGAIVGAFGYLMISGASFATVRSYVMITVMFLAVMLDRPALALRNVAIAALLILVVYPDSLFDAGFQMSFAAVVGLVAAYEWLRARRAARPLPGPGERRGPLGQGVHFFGEIIGTTIVASLVVAPFGIYHFHNTQLLAMLANVAAIPICNLIVMPAALGVLLAMPLGLEALPLWVMGAGIEAMSVVARWVGALPGAVVKVQQIPTVTFALMVAGGLWLLLWSQPWRLLGVLPIVIGLALSPSEVRPDILIGRDGLTVAVRGADRKLSALAVRGSSFDLTRWLELDGDSRAAVDVAEARAFSCDGIGCVARVGGKTIVVAMSLAALRDDCTAADIIIVRARAPRGCNTPKPGQIMIDPAHLARAGAHAITLHGERVRIVSVAEVRGRRPWSVSLSTTDIDATPVGRASGFTALFERFRQPIP
jgi:competence protein ComEC